MAKDTRSRMIDAAAESLAHRGLAAMSFTEVLARSGAARGAIYHHFPAGKNQLAAEAATRVGDNVGGFLSDLPESDPAAVVAAFLDLVRPVVELSARGGGCAVAAVTVDLDDGGELRAVAAGAFSSWVTTLSQKLAAAAMPVGEARDLAYLLLNLLEGAHVLCRATRTLDPFDRAADAARALVARA